MSSRDRRARVGTGGYYLVQGGCFAALLTQVPTIQHRFGFSDGALTLILLLVPVVAGVGSVLAGAIAPRWGSALPLRIGGPAVGVAITLVGVAGRRELLYLAVALVGLLLGLVDATMNMQGVAVQRRYGRSILASLHALWSVGGIVGALATAGAHRFGFSLGAGLGAVGLLGAAVDVALGPLLLRRGEEAASAAPVPAGAPAARIPWRPILLIGLAVMFMYIADSATSNWSTKYLQDTLAASGSLAPLGVAAYLTCQLLGRAVADLPVRRFGPVVPVAVGGLLGALGMALVALAPAPAAGIAGFALVGFGLCVVVPQSFSAAGALDPGGTGTAIARVNLFNYVGFVVGAGLIGAVNEAAGLRWAFAVPAGLALGIVLLAPAFRVATGAPPRDDELPQPALP